jgi:hypothetical protein
VILPKQGQLVEFTTDSGERIWADVELTTGSAGGRACLNTPDGVVNWVPYSKVDRPHTWRFIGEFEPPDFDAEYEALLANSIQNHTPPIPRD